MAISFRGLTQALFQTVSVMVFLAIVAAMAVGGIFFYHLTKDFPMLPR